MRISHQRRKKARPSYHGSPYHSKWRSAESYKHGGVIPHPGLGKGLIHQTPTTVETVMSITNERKRFRKFARITRLEKHAFGGNPMVVRFVILCYNKHNWAVKTATKMFSLTYTSSESKLRILTHVTMESMKLIPKDRWRSMITHYFGNC
jgi:hypothetical protein